MSRYAFIMRGIPGSGKSTVARDIAQRFEHTKFAARGDTMLDGGPDFVGAVIHSTDDLCMVDGEYKFDIALAGERHAQNLQNFKESLGNNVPCVIVDNTNVKCEHYFPYVKLANEAGYRVIFIEMPHPSPALAANRNAHGVPIDVINQMVMDWEPSQHCITVQKVSQAAGIVAAIQAKAANSKRVFFAIGLAVGAFVMWLLP